MPSNSTHPIIVHARKVHKEMLARDVDLLNRVTREYLKAYKRLREKIKTLQLAATAVPDQASLFSLAATQSLLAGIRTEIGRFSSILADDLDTAIAFEVKRAGLDALGAVQASLPGTEAAQVALGWARIAPKHVYEMFAFTDPKGPLYANLNFRFGDAVADLTREHLMQGFMVGMHSTQIAELIYQATGMGLNWALNTARTATLWAYRSATHLNYQQNSDIIRGWIWMSARDRRTCMSCIALHGTKHSISEIQADHHSGRCYSIPILASYEELGIPDVAKESLEIESGEAWFKKLPESRQREMMGPAMYRAWKDGAFMFSQLSQIYYDPVYGKMHREASLKSILGDKAKLFYGK